MGAVVSATIPEVLRQATDAFTFEFRSATAGLTAIVVLIVLLTVREVVRAHGGIRAHERLQVLDGPTWPLLMAFGVIVVVRLAGLL